MQYTKRYDCAVLFLQDILQFNWKFLKIMKQFMTLWEKHKQKHTRDVFQYCKTLSRSSYVLH